MIAAFYHLYLARIKKVANAHGYAMTLHGSMSRDCDICLIPWTEEAEARGVVIGAIANELGISLLPDDPGVKPHGRLAWTLTLSGECFFDVSVMPKKYG